jgi:uncharacterized protein (TIGR03382 family)
VIWLLSMAFAADTPCYGHTHTTRLDTEHYWVEWQTPTINGDQAADLGDWAEAARDVYVDMGWPITAEPVALLAVPPILEPDTMSGLTRTHPCSVGDDVHPRVELFFGWYEDEAARGLVSHELAHVAQYGYVSPFTAATGTWMWWLEASATWMELKVTGDERAWARTTSGYLNQPWLGLHQPQAALLDPFRTGHMYGGTVFVRFLELNYGGPDVIRDSWAWAAQQDGQPVTVEDGLTGMGLDPDAVWHHWMAVATTAQLGVFTEIDSGIDVEERVQRWPRNGGPSTGAPAEDRLPQGHGLSTIRFDAELAPPGQAVQVRFEGDPGVRWRVVLARVDGARRGAPVVDYTPLDVVDGIAEGWVSGMEGLRDAYLVVSPADAELVGRSYTWSAEPIEDPGPMDGNVVLGEATEPGCACGGGAPSWALALLGLGLVRRRRR